MTYFAFAFKLNTGEEKLLIPKLSYEEFHKLLKTNTSFAKQFSQWFSFRTIFGLELENHADYVKYKQNIHNIIDDSDINCTIKKLSKIYI